MKRSVWWRVNTAWRENVLRESYHFLRLPVGLRRVVRAEQRVAQRAVADRLLLLAADSEAAPEVRAMAELKISRAQTAGGILVEAGNASEDDRAPWLSIAADFGQWIETRQLPSLTRAPVAPPGNPL